MKIFTMTKTVTRNLVKGPATLMYPQRERVYTPITRGRIENAIDRCIFCGLCARRCPTNAIVVGKEGKEWQIDRLKCCICNLCVEVCPVKCLSTDNHYSQPVTDRQMGIQKETVARSGNNVKKPEPVSRG
jgi:formate hydrogenlyase subunit 6/NADH:ubiquinone oxidoreductase subunit I